MGIHLSARLAWHDDGWNGHVCRKPALNTYCVGAKSFPGDLIAHERELETELRYAGRSIAELAGRYIPPCAYSVNAFGAESIPSYSNPPDFFHGGAERTSWELPPSTVCAWPYEAMYDDDVTVNGRLDNDVRRQKAKEFFEAVSDERTGRGSLIFYYANYSNPFSEDGAERYLLVGLSRIKRIGDELLYEGANEDVRARFAGGMIWARPITSTYPDEGLRLPYHKYRDRPEELAAIALFPENPRICKYGARHISDDAALGLLEQFLNSVRVLQSMGDDSEDWVRRERWLLECIAELWRHRGLYPGLLNAMKVLGAQAAIPTIRSICDDGRDQQAHSQLFTALEEGEAHSDELGIAAAEMRKLSRNWRLQDTAQQALLRDVLPRLGLDAAQMQAILSPQRAAHGIQALLPEINLNPYLIAEQYIGDGPDDIISWSLIDRGVLPSPQLGGARLAGVEDNDARRFRSLCVEHLRQKQNQMFLAADTLLTEINDRLARLPEWKRAVFSERFFVVDAAELAPALVLRTEDEKLWIYLRPVYEDEREVESVLEELVTRPDVLPRVPMTADYWREIIEQRDSVLAERAGAAYRAAVDQQAECCSAVFRKPLAVVTGGAGTGKTTVICAFVRAVRRTEGEGAPVLVLVPTGKASDRVREVLEAEGITRVATSTVHAFLARTGWQNPNFTLKRVGGARIGDFAAIVIDESSMLDLELAAALFRAVDWRSVRRLLLVGDASQLPPIGRGRVFSDVITWLTARHPENLTRLRDNLRQLLNQVEEKGIAILDLANLYAADLAGDTDRATSPQDEALLRKVQTGGDVDRDLRVVYWDESSSLPDQVIAAIERDMRADTGIAADRSAFDLWTAAFKGTPHRYQVLTPHRGDTHGVESINRACQERVLGTIMEKCGTLKGVTLYDKVIQIRNRSGKNALAAYDYQKKANVPVDVFNGEIGFVWKHPFHKGGRLDRIRVKFARKDHLGVDYGKVTTNGRTRTEDVEENLELAYAISVHKAQGSEFTRTYVVVPKNDRFPVSSELLYTALTRASRHCTVFVQGDVRTLLTSRRKENAQTRLVNTSLFAFRAVDSRLLDRRSWYAEGKIHQALSGDLVRSKSELVIANLLHERGVPFLYEMQLLAADGTMYLPDFTISWRGETYYWEHVGRLDLPTYRNHWNEKLAWYGEHFPGQLLTTYEGATLSRDAAEILDATFR
jgi:exodeoxyribonuclease V alpha subunit